MDKNRIEYRLEYPENKYDKQVYTEYFDTLTQVYDYITKHRITTFLIVKEELVASRMDV